MKQSLTGLLHRPKHSLIRLKKNAGLRKSHPLLMKYDIALAYILVLTKAVETIRTEYQQAVTISIPMTREIGNRFISIDYPSERIISSVATVLRKKHQDNILIINMSERTYETDLLPGHVLAVNFRGLPAPPLEILCRLCLQIHQWMSRSASNVVAVHCFPGLSRTAVLVSCYLAWSGVCVHPVDALVGVCAGLKIDVDNGPLLPSQKRYLNYFFDILTSSSPPRVPARSYMIKKLILNGVPNLPISDESLFRPFFEIWRDGHIVFTSLPGGAKDMAPDVLAAAVRVYPISRDSILQEDSCTVCFDNLVDCCPISGDLLFRIRHLGSKGARFTCLRFAFNSNYVNDGLVHLARQELDGNILSHCVVDLVMEEVTDPIVSQESREENARITEIFKRSIFVSSRLRQGLPVSEYEGGDELEDALVKSVSSPVPERPPAILIGQPTTAETHEMTPTPPGDDIDDFFAQLEKEAQI